MSEAESSSPQHLRKVIPYVWVADVDAALPYYRDTLGFTEIFRHKWEYDDQKFGLIMLERDGIPIQLQVCECGDYRHTGLAFFQIEVAKIDELYSEFAAAGARFRFEIKTQSWNVRDFQVEDPEGNRIYFFECL